MKFKVGDKVRVRKDLVIGEEYDNYEFGEYMEEYKGKVFTIEIVDNDDGSYDLKEVGYYWTDEMLEEVNEYEIEKTFREVIADIKEGEVWESSLATISRNNVGVEIKFKEEKHSKCCFCDGVMFNLKRKGYTFVEAFKSYEEGKEIEDCKGVRYKKINGADCYNIERNSHFCTRVDETDYWLGFEEIRGKWYINN